MRLYQGTCEQFTDDIKHNRVTEKLDQQFKAYYGHAPAPSEKNAWNNSLQFLRNAIETAELNDNALVIEYELPYCTKRIDCLLFGTDEKDEESVVVMELKQWDSPSVKESEIEENVKVYIAGGERDETHPSYKVKGYHLHLKDFVQFFNETPTPALSSCVYCHNYTHSGNDVLFLPKFREIIKEIPIYTRDDTENLGKYLKERLGKGNGLEILNRFAMSNICPSKKLLEHVKTTIGGQPVFNLIDEQLDAYYTIIDRAKKSAKTKEKSVIIVKGGPGTGKSVIAINVLAELSAKGIPVFHATGSAAFTSTLRKLVGTRAATLFKYFNSFLPADYGENQISVLICDEAHRIRKNSNNMYTPSAKRSDLPQIEQLLRVAKVGIFFIDDYQVVRPEEIGSTELIHSTAEKFGAKIYEFELKTQFRCSGSDGYLSWLDNTLGIRDTANRMLTKEDKMEFKIFSNPAEMFEEVKKKNAQKPNSARLVAGFCWKWSDANPDGTLNEDVVIGDFKITWEAKNDAKKLTPGIPYAKYWAFDPNGVNQCGSIYTIQGFEFEYVGVIVGKDIVYDKTTGEFVGKPENSADSTVKRAKGEFAKYIKNAYRVLLTRGMKGCYVYFMDKDTEDYFRSRIESKTKQSE